MALRIAAAAFARSALRSQRSLGAVRRATTGPSKVLEEEAAFNAVRNSMQKHQQDKAFGASSNAYKVATDGLLILVLGFSMYKLLFEPSFATEYGSALPHPRDYARDLFYREMRGVEDHPNRAAVEAKVKAYEDLYRWSHEGGDGHPHYGVSVKK